MLGVLHRALHGVGSFIAKFCILALVAALFLGPVAAAIYASVFGGIWLKQVTGGGDAAWLIAMLAISAFVGWYVAPYVQPQIKAALMALMADPQLPPRKGDPEPRLR